MEALKSAITPITHNLPAPIRDLGVSIIGETCYKSLLLDVNIEDADCIKFAVSKALGIGIIAASSIVKVPQILKLLNSKSAEGVSFLSYLLETASYIISLAYNFRNGFPFSTYGETALIVGQNVIISVLVLNYSGRASLAAVFVAALAGTVATLFAENVVDAQTLSYLQAGAGVLSVASKLPQILTIFQQGWYWSAQRFRCLQLPCRIFVPNLHNPPGGRRQAHSLRIRLWLRPQRHPCSPDDLLLERSLREGQGQATSCSHCGQACYSDSFFLYHCYSQEEPYHSPTWLDG
ncbi:hypothetical protein NW765_001798 [Fusarium oxysporum]|nr:hypothetical protein NW765_001798 [Fusarium oxysporum]